MPTALAPTKANSTAEIVCGRRRSLAKQQPRMKSDASNGRRTTWFMGLPFREMVFIEWLTGATVGTARTGVKNKDTRNGRSLCPEIHI
jgi:hypothetical protein